MGSNRPTGRGQKRAAKTKARQRRQTSAPTAPAAVRATARLLTDFVEWMRGQDAAGDIEPTRRVVESLLGELTRVRPDFTPTAWTPDDAHLVLDAAETVLDQDLDTSEDAALHLVFSSLSFLTFLDDEDLWSGTDADYEHCMEDLTDFVDSLPDLIDPADIELPDVSASDEANALADLAVVTRLDSLLAWAGRGRPVNAKEVAEGLRIDVPASTFQGVGDVPELADLWHTALDAQLIEVADTGAAPGASAAGFRARELEVLRSVVAAYVRAQLSVDEEIDVSRSVAENFAAQTVLAAMTPDPPEANLDEDYESLEGEDRRTAELVAARLKSFVADGILVGTELLLVPPQLQRAVLDGVATARIFGTESVETETPEAEPDVPDASDGDRPGA